MQIQAHMQALLIFFCWTVVIFLRLLGFDENPNYVSLTLCLYDSLDTETISEDGGNTFYLQLL